MAIRSEASLRVGTKVVDTGKSDRLYRVGKANGDWLWLTSGSIGGWASAKDVLTLDRAIEVYSAEIARDPNAIGPYLRRGRLRHARRDFEGAIADYSKVLRIDPRSVTALANRGIARQASGELNKAIADYDEAIRLGLKTAQTFNNRGHCWELKKDYGKAMADYNEAIRIDPNYLYARLNRGNTWKAKGDLVQALADYEAATETAPKSPWGYALQAEILSSRPGATEADHKKAVELATRATELGGTQNAYLCEVRAAAHEAAGQHEAATEWRAKARDAAEHAPGVGSVAGAVLPRRPYERAPIGAFPIPPTWTRMRSASSGNVTDTIITSTGGAATATEPQPNSYYGANYLLLPNAGGNTFLPQAGNTNINYSSSIPTYTNANTLYSLAQSGTANGHPTGTGPVSPVNPTYYGANLSGRTLVTPNYSSSPFSPTFYGANYNGTATFNPGNPANFAPVSPIGTSFYGADYSNTMNFQAGSFAPN